MDLMQTAEAFDGDYTLERRLLCRICVLGFGLEERVDAPRRVGIVCAVFEWRSLAGACLRLCSTVVLSLITLIHHEALGVVCRTQRLAEIVPPAVLDDARVGLAHCLHLGWRAPVKLEAVVH